MKLLEVKLLSLRYARTNILLINDQNDTQNEASPEKNPKI